MADTLKHKFVSTKPESADTTIVSKNEWNEEHAFTGGTNGQYLTRSTGASDGAAWLTLPSPLTQIDPLIINVKSPPYNAIGDGIADDTAAIQAAINVFSSLSVTGRIVIPVATYNISTTLLYIGNTSNALTIGGTTRPGIGISGSLLKWIGSSGGTVFEMRGSFYSQIENIGINGNNFAGRGIFIKSNQPAGGTGSSGVHIEHVVIRRGGEEFDIEAVRFINQIFFHPGF